MFDSLKHWFENHQENSSLFDHPEQEIVHIALASLLYHIISIDERESDKEKRDFRNILADEFDLTDKQITGLYSYVKTLKSDIKIDLETIKEHLSDNPNLRMRLMSKLIHLISVGGVDTKEIETFYDAMKAIFPDIEDPRAI